METPTEKQVLLVSFNSMEGKAPRTTYFQVTVDPNHISPDGKYIRFGDVSGDEIVGWVELAEIDIHSVLFDYPENKELHYTGQDVGIQMLDNLNGMRRENYNQNLGAKIDADAADNLIEKSAA